MANLTVVKSGNRIDIDLGVYASDIGLRKESYRADDIVEVSLCASDTFVEIMMRDSHESATWYVTWDPAYSGSEYFIVDTVDTLAPTSQEDLYDKLKALM